MSEASWGAAVADQEDEEGSLQSAGAAPLV